MQILDPSVAGINMPFFGRKKSLCVALRNCETCETAIRINTQRLRNGIILNALQSIFNEERDGLTISAGTESVTVTDQLYRERRGIFGGQPQSLEVKWDASYMLTVTADPYHIPMEMAAENYGMKSSIDPYPKVISVYHFTHLIQTGADWYHYALPLIDNMPYLIFWDTILYSHLIINFPPDRLRADIWMQTSGYIKILSPNQIFFLELQIDSLYNKKTPFRNLRLVPWRTLPGRSRQDFDAMCLVLETHFGTNSPYFGSSRDQSSGSWSIWQRLETMSDIDILMRLLVLAQTIYFGVA